MSEKVPERDCVEVSAAEALSMVRIMSNDKVVSAVNEYAQYANQLRMGTPVVGDSPLLTSLEDEIQTALRPYNVKLTNAAIAAFVSGFLQARETAD